MINRALISKEMVVREEDGRITDHHTFIRMIDYWRDWLTARGLSKGHTVGICIFNCPEMLALLFACFEMGIIFMGTEQHLFHTCERVKAVALDAIITEEEIAGEVRAVGGDKEIDVPILEAKVPLTEADLEPFPFREAAPQFATADDGALLWVTSGTTGTPARVTHTHATVSAAITRASRFYEDGAPVCYYVNLNHLGVQSIFSLPIFLKGCQISMIRRVPEPTMFKLFTERPSQTFLMFSRSWADLLNWHKEKYGTDLKLPGRPTIVTGGDVALKDYLASLFAAGVGKVHVSYGMTEALTPVMTKTLTPDALEEYDSTDLGTPEEGWEVDVNDDGCLMVRGVGIGVRNGESITDENGWYHSTDGVERRNGVIHFTGRRSGTIKRNGQTLMVSGLNHMNQYLFNNPEPHEAHVVHCEVDGEIYLVWWVASHVRLYGDKEITHEYVNDFMAKYYSPDYYIDYVFRADQLPFNGLKVDAKELRKMSVERIKALRATS